MTPPRNCRELARRLKQAAQPLHGRTYHDLRLAAAIIDAIGHWRLSTSAQMLGNALAADPSLYHVEPESDR